jgi:hypothetical protein
MEVRGIFLCLYLLRRVCLEDESGWKIRTNKIIDGGGMGRDVRESQRIDLMVLLQTEGRCGWGRK